MSVPRILLVIAMTVAGCSGATPVSPEPTSAATNTASSSSSEGTGAVVELRFDQALKYQVLELRWLELEDSRCPTGATCVWEGQVVITVEVASGEGTPVDVKLLLRSGHESDASRAFDYELRLQGVEPHPWLGATPERGDYTARIEITEP